MESMSNNQPIKAENIQENEDEDVKVVDGPDEILDYKLKTKTKAPPQKWVSPFDPTYTNFILCKICQLSWLMGIYVTYSCPIKVEKNGIGLEILEYCA